jgi:hypothetical protein
MPRRTVDIHDVILRLKILNAGQRDVKYKAEMFVPRRDLDRIRQLILATGLDDVNIKDLRDMKKKGK